MKKLIFAIALVMINFIAFSQQYSVQRTTRAVFIAGIISIPNDTLCSGQLSQQITGTTPTGGLPTPAPTYQWQIYTSTNPVWTNILGATTLNLQTGSLTGGDYSYRRIDNDPGCGSKDTTNVVAIHVWNVFVAGTATGGGNFCYGVTGTTTTCTAATGGNPTTTQELQTSTNGTTWTNTGVTALSYTPAGVLTSDIYVRWEFRNACDTLWSNTILYHVYPQLVAGTASTTTTSPICYGTNGGTATATAATGGNIAGTTVEWENSADGITWTNTGNFTLAYSFGIMTAPRWTRIRYMNLCDTLWSNTLFIDVYAPLAHGGTPVLIGANDTICLNTDPGNIDAPAATGGNNVFAYQWQSRFNSGTWTNISGATLEDYDIPSLTVSGLYEYQRIANTGCGTVTSPSVAIYVYPAFNAGVIGSDAETCSGAAQAPIIQITAASGGSGYYTYQWIESTDNEATWHNAPGASTGTGYTPATITTPVDLDYFYRRIVTDTYGCGSSPSTAQ